MSYGNTTWGVCKNSSRPLKHGRGLGGYFFFEGSGVEEAFSIGPPEASHPLMPPSNAPASLNPFCCSKSAARALVCSFGQPQ